MLSRVTLKRSIQQYKTIVVEHDDDLHQSHVGRKALAQCNGENYERREGERMRRYVHKVELNYAVVKEE